MFMPAVLAVTVEVVSEKFTFPLTSQSPAVNEILVTLAEVAVVKFTADPDAIAEETVSPTLPA